MADLSPHTRWHVSTRRKLLLTLKSKNYDALIFDLDGTLWDSTVSVAEAWAHTVMELGEELPKVTAEEVSRMMGMTIEEIFKRYFPQLPPDRQKIFSAKLIAKQKMILKHQQGIIYPDVETGLKKLAAAYPLYIVSNCHEPYLEMFFEQSQLESLFKGWECYGRTGRPKTDNLKSLAVAHKLKHPCYIGDTAGDQSAAVKAGMDFYHASYGFGDPESECMRFWDFKELTSFFLGLQQR